MRKMKILFILGWMCVALALFALSCMVIIQDPEIEMKKTYVAGTGFLIIAIVLYPINTILKNKEED